MVYSENMINSPNAFFFSCVSDMRVAETNNKNGT